MSAPILQDLCQRLQLGEVGRLAESRADQAAAAQQAYTVYLADLLQAEADARQQRYITSRTQMAHLPFHKTLDTFDFGFQPSIDERPRSPPTRASASGARSSGTPCWRRRFSTASCTTRRS